MNRKFILVIVMLLMISIVSGILCSTVNIEKEGKKEIATSFYPTYLITENLLKDMDNIKVVNIAENVQGCIHNFQLTPENMKTLENTDALVINGMGMENYITDLVSKVKTIHLIDSSIGINPLESNGHHHHEIEDNHEHENMIKLEQKHEHNHVHNSHIWLSLDNYKLQVENISKGLEKIEYVDKIKLESNKKEYLQKVESLKKQKDELSSKLKDKHVHTITFHDSFAYLLKELNIEVLKNIDVENQGGLSALEAKNAIDLINKHNVKYIIADQNLKREIPEVLEKETNVKVIYLNNIVQSKSKSLNNYISEMQSNLNKLNKIGE